MRRINAGTVFLLTCKSPMSNVSISFQEGYDLCNTTVVSITSLDGATYQDFRLDLGPLTELYRENLSKFLSCAIDPALDRADGAVADVSGLLIGKARRADENKRLALIRRELEQRLAELPELDMAG